MELDETVPVCDTPKRCFVCLGIIKNDEMVKCTDCGRPFHPNCAKRVERCPLCGDDLMEVDDIG